MIWDEVVVVQVGSKELPNKRLQPLEVEQSREGRIDRVEEDCDQHLTKVLSVGKKTGMVWQLVCGWLLPESQESK